jgi:hypothetical protein
MRVVRLTVCSRTVGVGWRGVEEVRVWSDTRAMQGTVFIMRSQSDWGESGHAGSEEFRR